MTVYNESPNKTTASISFAVFVDDATNESVAEFYEFVREMSRMAVDLEGTMSTYIGDGDRLGGFSEFEHGPSYEYMRRIKEIFDPGNIFNPGKKFEIALDSGRPYRRRRKFTAFAVTTSPVAACNEDVRSMADLSRLDEARRRRLHLQPNALWLLS